MAVMPGLGFSMALMLEKIFISGFEVSVVAAKYRHARY